MTLGKFQVQDRLKQTLKTDVTSLNPCVQVRNEWVSRMRYEASEYTGSHGGSMLTISLKLPELSESRCDICADGVVSIMFHSLASRGLSYKVLK